MYLYYVRHGDPIYDPDQLTPLGHRQAEAIGRRLAMHGLDEVYMSSSNRAMETAQPVCEMLKIKPEILDWTNEMHAWNQMTVDHNGRKQWAFLAPEIVDLFMSKEVRDLRDRWYDHPAFAGTTFKEGMLRVQRETRNFLKNQGYEYEEEKGQYRSLGHNDKRVALFAHHGFGMIFLSSLLDIPYPEVSTKMSMTHTGLTVIYFDPNKEYVVPQMLQLSSDGHLYKEGLPTKFANQFYI